MNYDDFLQENYIEEIKIRKYTTCLIIAEIVYASFFILNGYYKNGIGAITFLIIIVLLLMKQILKYKKVKIRELTYSRILLMKNEKEIRKEWPTECKKEKDYLLLKNYYLDFVSKNIVELNNIKEIKLRTYISLPFYINSGGHFLLIVTKDNHTLNIFNFRTIFNNNDTDDNKFELLESHAEKK